MNHRFAFVVKESYVLNKNDLATRRVNVGAAAGVNAIPSRIAVSTSDRRGTLAQYAGGQRRWRAAS
jgi:hypothetical protein